jgi:hypothetical protein
MGTERHNTAPAGTGGIRELDVRTSDGIEVRLLWEPQTDRVSIVVTDIRADSSFAFEVDRADAVAAFHHPYAYASHDQTAHALPT